MSTHETHEEDKMPISIFTRNLLRTKLSRRLLLIKLPLGGLFSIFFRVVMFSAAFGLLGVVVGLGSFYQGYIVGLVFYMAIQLVINSSLPFKKGKQYEERNLGLVESIYKSIGDATLAVPLVLVAVREGNIDLYSGSECDAMNRIRDFHKERALGTNQCQDGHTAMCAHRNPPLGRWING